MPYSGAGQLRLPLLSCLVALLLCGCGNGGHSATDSPGATNSTTTPATPQDSIPTKAAVNVSTNAGGYITNQTSSIFCDSTSEFCNYQTAPGAIESMTAVSRYGYRFRRWQSNATNQTISSTQLQLVADNDTSVKASFEEVTTLSEPACPTPTPSIRFRALHLGDSLTAVQCWQDNCPTYSRVPLHEPEREAVRFYEMAMANNTDAPRIIAVGGNRSIGTNWLYSPTKEDPVDFENDNYWQSVLEKHRESLDDFDAIVVALGTNDIFDIPNQIIDMDLIFEYRILPLMRWLGEKPVLWILPHYTYRSFSRGELNLHARKDGIACSCGTNAPATTTCDLAHVLEQCNATTEEAHDTIEMFKAIHLFRKRMLALQTEYPNLQVVDAEQLVAQQSHGRYDLYQQLEGDKIHFNKQGTEWYAWAHAYLAQSKNPGCDHALPSWDMSSAETAMMARLNSIP